MSEVLAAEWLKIRTARPTIYVLGVVALFTLLMLGLAWYFVVTWDGLPPAGRANSALGSLPELMGWITSLTMAVFGSLAITSEYASGMIRMTFIAMPRRGVVLVYKAVVVALITFAATEIALLVTLLGSAFIIGARSIHGQAPLDVSALALLLAMGLSTTTFALLGLALGALTRSALASIVALVMVWYIVPLLAAHVSPPWNAWLSSAVPGALAGQLAGTSNANTVFGAALPPWAAGVAMLAYAVIPLMTAAIVIGRRDA